MGTSNTKDMGYNCLEAVCKCWAYTTISLWCIIAFFTGLFAFWLSLPSECTTIGADDEGYERGDQFYLFVVGVLQGWFLWPIQVFCCQFQPSRLVVTIMCPINTLTCK